MTQAVARKNRRLAYRMVALQLLISLLAAAAGLLFSGTVALSLLLGGLVVVVPNLYFATKVFATTGASNAKKVMRAFYLGEVMKWILTFTGLILVVKLINVSPAALFLGFGLVVMSQLLAPLVVTSD